MSFHHASPIQRKWRAIQPGAVVRILRRDIHDFRNWTTAKRRPRGIIRRVDGGYIYVKPNVWPRNRPPLELYENEIEVVRS